jgi:hypothetical protein
MSSLTDLLQTRLDITNPSNGNGSSYIPSAVTSQMFDALDSVGEEKPSKTAASVLLEEKKRLKNQLQTIESTNFTIPKDNSNPLAPLVQQVADNTALFDFSKHNKNQSKNKKQQVYQPPSKKSLKLKQKGEEYSDRHKEKLNKQKVKGKLKRN